jgi:hypothetical protein
MHWWISRLPRSSTEALVSLLVVWFASSRLEDGGRQPRRPLCAGTCRQPQRRPEIFQGGLREHNHAEANWLSGLSTNVRHPV